MDPLSITTSILTLIGAASKTYGFLQFIAHADEDATSLCTEVSGLGSVLSLVQAALNKCGGNPLNLASIDQGLWRRIDITLSDCREALDSLSQLAQSIRFKHSALVPGLLYRAGVAKRLQQHTKDVASYRDRIKVSNWNLQTLLQVIDVSLSLANRESYTQISSQLDLLNQRIQDRGELSLYLNRSNSISERRFLHNTEDFLLAIKAFHKSASTTAGTVQGHSEHSRDTTGGTNQDESSSVVSRMPTRKRHEIATLLQRHEKQGLLPTTPTALQVKDAKAIASPLDGPQLAPLRINPTTVLTDGFSKLAHKAFQDLDFLGAETFLRRAMEQHKNTGVDSVQHRRLRKQLSLSLFFQGRDEDAKELILDLAEHYEEDLNTTPQLLFALALSLAHDMEFDEARAICEQLCHIRCMSDDGSSGMLSKNDVFRLLVTCYRQSRDWMSADAIIAEIPDIDEDQCVPSPLEFILRSDDLLFEFLGDAGCRTTPSMFVSQVQSLPVARRVTRLQERLDGASLFTTRFAASETGDEQGVDGFLPTKSRHLHTARQAIKTGSNKNHASLHATYARLFASLKNLAFKGRLHSSFELLQWQRCTSEVEKVMPVRDILSWREGLEAAGHGMTPVTDRFPDDGDYSLDISGLPALLLPELDSNEVKTAATLPQSEGQSDASCHLPLASSPIQRTNTGISVVCGSSRENLKTDLNWDPSSLAWIRPSGPTLPALHWDDRVETIMARNALKMDAPFACLCSPSIEETKPHELPAITAGPWNAWGLANPFSVSGRGMHPACCCSLQALNIFPEFSNFCPFIEPSFTSSPENWLLDSLGSEIPPTCPMVWYESDKSGIRRAPKPSEKMADYPRITKGEQVNLPNMRECEMCQWRPDRPHVFSGSIISQLKATVEKHVKRSHS